jgi:hypothetical protein
MPNLPNLNLAIESGSLETSRTIRVGAIETPRALLESPSPARKRSYGSSPALVKHSYAQ